MRNIRREHLFMLYFLKNGTIVIEMYAGSTTIHAEWFSITNSCGCSAEMKILCVVYKATFFTADIVPGAKVLA